MSAKAVAEISKNIVIRYAFFMITIFAYIQSDTLDDGTVVGDFVNQKSRPTIYSKIKRRGISDLDEIFSKRKINSVYDI